MTEEELNTISQAATRCSQLAMFLDDIDRHHLKNLDRDLLYIVRKYEAGARPANNSIPFYGYDTAHDNLYGAQQELKTAIEDFESANDEGEWSVENASIFASINTAMHRIYMAIEQLGFAEKG